MNLIGQAGKFAPVAAELAAPLLSGGSATLAAGIAAGSVNKVF
jgi:hypothetical protein